MKLKQSPFPSGWWGTSLENIGLERQRPDVGTYGRYEQSNLPELPLSLNGTYSWLGETDTYAEHIGAERQAENAEGLPLLETTCKASGITLPPSFVKFFATPELHMHIRSNTDCFLDLAEQPTASPVGEGVLIRFLADSQGCVFWYLFIPAGLNDHAVVSSPEFYGPEADSHEHITCDDIVFCEESFEQFICRFWIENELWFSEFDGTPMSDVGTTISRVVHCFSSRSAGRST